MCVKKDGTEACGFHFIHKRSENILPDLKDNTYIDIKGQVNTCIDMTGILTVKDSFLSSTATFFNLIPGIEEALPR